MSRSLVEEAYQIISESKGKIPFVELLGKIGKNLGIGEEDLLKKAGTFYTDMLLDGRFVVVDDNQWDLKTRHISSEYIHDDVTELMEDEGSEDVSELDEASDEEKKSDIDYDVDESDDDNNAGSAGLTADDID